MSIQKMALLSTALWMSQNLFAQTELPDSVYFKLKPILFGHELHEFSRILNGFLRENSCNSCPKSIACRIEKIVS